MEVAVKPIVISAVVLRGKKVDEKLLTKCLNSLEWCDEVVKINTSEIPGSFAEWRNEGAGRAIGEWILYVDSDEEITKSLQEEIYSLINNPQSPITAYAIPRKNYIFGREFRHGGQWPDYQVRLFKKNKFIRWEGNLHERPVFKGVLGYSENPINHYKNMTISQMIEKTNNWSEIEAKLLLESNHPMMNFARFASVAIREFWLRFILQLGFLDGKEGIIYNSYQVYSKLITYSKLWELQLKK